MLCGHKIQLQFYAKSNVLVKYWKQTIYRQFMYRE